jgi:hypothetical protein
MPFTTSDALPTLVGAELMALLNEAKYLLSALRAEYPHLSHLFDQPFQQRAAFAIPQLCTEISYHSVSGHFMNAAQRRHTMQYAMVCLATGAGDDLVDMPVPAFRERMNLACTSVIFGNSAYTYLIRHHDERLDSLVTAALDEMLNRLTTAGCSEIEYNDTTAFDVTSYLRLARQKTTSYTIPAFSLGAGLSGATSDQHHHLREIGLRIGTVLQLIDDLLDAPHDYQSNRGSCSYPAALALRRESLQPISDLIEGELKHGLLSSSTLPHPAYLNSVFHSIRDNLSVLGSL